MRISVDTNNVKLIEKQQIESGEYNVTPCLFEFSEEYEGLIKTAVFTNKDKQAYNMLIQDDMCKIPYEVLEKEGTVELGVFGYVIEDDDLELRYSPKPCLFAVSKGSYKEAENSTPPTPTQFEQYEQALEEGLEQVANVDIDANKEGHTATVTITDKTGATKTIQIEDGIDGIDGVGLNYNWSGTSLGVKREDETNYQYVNLKGEKGDPGAIKMIIVNELPQTGEDDTIYLVPNDDPQTQNNYDEYIYTNGEWEKLGGVQVQIDLTDYVKNTDYATSSTGGVIKSSSNVATSMSNGVLIAQTKNYEEYTGASNGSFVGKGTLENVITGKGLVSNTNYADNSTAGVIKTSGNYGTGASTSTGILYSAVRTYEQYQSDDNRLFVSKGTLENIITGKGLVSNTDYATSSVGGVIKVNSPQGTGVYSSGVMYALTRDYNTYSNDSSGLFIGKGTLENVLTARIGSIETILETLDTGSGV